MVYFIVFEFVPQNVLLLQKYDRVVNIPYVNYVVMSRLVIVVCARCVNFCSSESALLFNFYFCALNIAINSD